MAIVIALILNLAGLVLMAGLVLVVWALYYHFSTAEVPVGVCQPIKLRILHTGIVMVFGLDYIFWKIGFSPRYTMVCLAIDRFPSFRDSKVSTRMTFFDGVSVRIYQPKEMPAELNRGMMFFHGGCGLFGSIDSHDTMCRYISKESNSVVVSVEYHLAPKHPHPTLFTECRNATVHFMRNAEKYGVDPARIILGGDSIGGTVVAYISQVMCKRTDLTRIRAQILMYPYLQALDFSLPSHQQNSHFPIVSLEQCITFALQYLNAVQGLPDIVINGSFVLEKTRAQYRKWVSSDLIPVEFKNRNPKVLASVCPESSVPKILQQILSTLFSPLLADDEIVKATPEAFILTCEYDILRDDGILYKERLEANGVPVSFYNLDNGFHGSLAMIDRWFFSFPCAKTGLDRVVNFIQGL